MQSDGHRVTSGIGGRRLDDLQPLGVVLGTVAKPGNHVAVASGRAKHAGTVSGDPNLGRPALIRRKVEYRVAQQEERQIAVTSWPLEAHSARIVASGSSNRATGFDQSRPYGWSPTRSPGPIPRIVRPRVSRFNVAMACAVTAGLRRPVSVTPMPSRQAESPTRGQAPSSVQASIAASGERSSRAVAGTWDPAEVVVSHR